MNNFVPIKILLVEDNLGDERLVREALKDARIINEVTSVPDGVQAMEVLLTDYRPDLIILDLNLPKKSGREVLEELKSTDKLKNIPVIILTSSQAESDIESMYSLGASSYLTKPVDFENFMGCINAFESFWLSFVKFPKK